MRCVCALLPIPHQCEQVEHGHAVLRAASMAALQLLQAVRNDTVRQLAARVQVQEQHAHTLVPRCQNHFGEEHLPGRGDAGQNTVQHLVREKRRG